jgi:hypothetical protein
MLSLAAIATALLLSTGTANANNVKTGNENGVIPVEVKYVGSVNQQPVLEISLDNDTAEDYKVTLTDNDGTVLYSGTFSSKKIVKRFQFANGGLEPMHITLTVATKKVSQTETFEISETQQVITGFVVEKL